jgi:hypothetical protein
MKEGEVSEQDAQPRMVRFPEDFSMGQVTVEVREGDDWRWLEWMPARGDVAVPVGCRLSLHWGRLEQDGLSSLEALGSDDLYAFSTHKFWRGPANELAHLSRLTGLRKLSLGYEMFYLTAEGATHLEGLCNLEQLSVGATDDEALGHVRHLSALKRFGPSGIRVTDAGLPYLAQLRNLEALYLSDTGITDAGLPYLAQLRNLETLHLAETKITGSGLFHLADLPKLTELDLSSTKVTGERLVGIPGMARLRGLNLYGTHLTSRSLQFLTRLSELRALDLDDTRLEGPHYGIWSV